MILILGLLCLAASPAFGFHQKNLKVRFDFNTTTYGLTSFMEMPLNITTASERGWQEMVKPDLSPGYESLVLWCPAADNCTLCMLFDDIGELAGLQISINPDNFVGAIFNWTVSGFTTWNVTVDGVTVQYQSIHQYYISNETLAKDSETRRASRNKDLILQDDLYVEGFYGDLFTVSSNVTTLNKSIFVKQGCIPGMGNHYYYNMSRNLVCGDDTVFSWFPLVTDDQVTGVGFSVPGKYTISDDKLNPFENPSTVEIIEVSVPDAPDCMRAYADNPGVFTMHTYFIDDGPSITCT